ncbi:DNA-binding protein [Methylobacterium phyllosphaerae]
MVTENDVRAAAARIRARPAPPGSLKERVSVRSVRKELGGGSFGDIAKPLAKWKADEGYHPAIEQADLPEAFEKRLAALARDLLEQARMEATRERLSDFADVERRRRATRRSSRRPPRRSTILRTGSRRCSPSWIGCAPPEA